MHPKFYNDLLGKKVNQDVQKGTPLSDNFLDK